MQLQCKLTVYICVGCCTRDHDRVVLLSSYNCNRSIECPNTKINGTRSTVSFHGEPIVGLPSINCGLV